MRTVTFSNPAVAKVVNDHFVSAWFNRSPGFKNGSYRTEEAIFKRSAFAFTTKNICTFVMTPKGEVFSYVAEYLYPGLFMEFLKNALTIRECAFDERMELKRGGIEVVRRLHQDRFTDLSRLEKSTVPECDFDEGRYREVSHVHGSTCSWVKKTTYKYLSRLHKHWSGVKTLPQLDKVRYTYLYGNQFTEEGSGAAAIARDPAIPMPLRCGGR